MQKQQLKAFSHEIRTGAYTVCFVSYRLRELTFCVSPALISMAAVDLILAKDNALKKIKPEVFGSLRSVLSTLPH